MDKTLEVVLVGAGTAVGQGMVEWFERYARQGHGIGHVLVMLLPLCWGAYRLSQKDEQ